MNATAGWENAASKLSTFSAAMPHEVRLSRSAAFRTTATLPGRPPASQPAMFRRNCAVSAFVARWQRKFG